VSAQRERERRNRQTPDQPRGHNAQAMVRTACVNRKLPLSPASRRKIRLALATGACFIPFNLQLERKPPGYGPAAKAALAGLFAVLLLWSTTLAVSSAHRQSHQSASTAAHQTCVLCLFAHGQITAADTAVTLAGGTGAPVDLPPSPGAEFSASFDYRLSPSRAPPFSFSV
jgi:hypothetical protein